MRFILAMETWPCGPGSFLSASVHMAALVNASCGQMTGVKTPLACCRLVRVPLITVSLGKNPGTVWQATEGESDLGWQRLS